MRIAALEKSMSSDAATELTAVFSRTADKRIAHERARQVLQDLSGSPEFLAAILARHLADAGNLGRLHYPVVSLDVALTPDYHLVANCWIPLPDGRTNLSTKAVHHHGSMLLTSVTGFGPGYEHWLFSLPERLEPDREIYSTRLLDRSQHPLHHVAFVDSYTAHLPFYPPALTITFALWSSEHPTTWKDKVKRVPFLQKRAGSLRKVAAGLGLAGSLDLKVVENFDFYPVANGLCVIPERVEFQRGPNEDYLYSLFHVLQGTGNEHLGSVIEGHLQHGRIVQNETLVRTLLSDLRAGKRIEGRLSAGHTDLQGANFTIDELVQAVAACQPDKLPPMGAV